MILPYIALSDAVAAYINAETYAQAVTAVRRFSHIENKQSLTGLKCSVIPGALVKEEMTFGGTQTFGQTVAVILQQKVKNNSAAMIDPLVALTMEIHNSLHKINMATTPISQWIDGGNIGPYDFDSITHGVFMSSFEINYTVEVAT